MRCMHTLRQDDLKFDSREPVYLQIAEHLRRRVALKDLAPGERLPAIRKLAAQLNLDPGTVARADKELEREGVISSRRGGGSFVSAASGQRRVEEQRRNRLVSQLESAVVDALSLGFTLEEVETAFTLQLASLRERTMPPPLAKTAGERVAGEIRFAGSHDVAGESPRDAASGTALQHHICR